MFSVAEWIDLLICVQESIEQEQKRVDSTGLVSMKAAGQKRIDELLSIKGRIRDLLGKGK